MSNNAAHRTVGAERCDGCQERVAEVLAECAGDTCTMKLCGCCRGASGKCADCLVEEEAHARRESAERFRLAEILLGVARFHFKASPFAGGRP